MLSNTCTFKQYYIIGISRSFGDAAARNGNIHHPVIEGVTLAAFSHVRSSCYNEYQLLSRGVLGHYSGTEILLNASSGEVQATVSENTSHFLITVIFKQSLLSFLVQTGKHARAFLENWIPCYSPVVSLSF